MDKQTWPDALMKVGTALWKWPLLVTIPVGLYAGMVRYPYNLILNLCMVVYFVVGVSVTIRQHIDVRKRMRQEHERRAKAMDDASVEVERCQAEFLRLIKVQGELFIAGKTEEAQAMATQMHAVIEEQTKWMLKAVGIDETDTK